MLVQAIAPDPPRPSSFSSGFSFVEGGNYGNAEEEIEAMGGDPFFLDDNTDPEQGADVTDPCVEWDGTIDEDAQLD